jgi:hypothetical protein
MVAALTFALTLGGATRIGWFEAEVAVAHLTGSASALRRVADACVNGHIPCRVVSWFLNSPDAQTGVLGWIASDPFAPRDVMLALAQSDNPDVRRKAVVNLENRPQPDP